MKPLWAPHGYSFAASRLNSSKSANLNVVQALCAKFKINFSLNQQHETFTGSFFISCTWSPLLTSELSAGCCGIPSRKINSRFRKTFYVHINFHLTKTILSESSSSTEFNSSYLCMNFHHITIKNILSMCTLSKHKRRIFNQYFPPGFIANFPFVPRLSRKILCGWKKNSNWIDEKCMQSWIIFVECGFAKLRWQL